MLWCRSMIAAIEPLVIRNYGSGIDEVCECLSPLLKEAETKKALGILSRDFVDPDSLGPSRVAQFEPSPRQAARNVLPVTAVLRSTGRI
jgi:hypothetical protein